MSKKSVAGLVIGFVVAIASAQASAAYVSGAGNSCQEGYGSPTDSVFHDDLGAMNRSTTSAAMLLCPLAMGATNNTAEAIQTLFVQGFDRSSTGSVNCYFTRTLTTFGGSQYWSYTKSSDWAGTGAFALSWTWSFERGGIDNIDVGNPITVRCDLPPATSSSPSGASAIVGYYVYY